MYKTDHILINKSLTLNNIKIICAKLLELKKDDCFTDIENKLSKKLICFKGPSGESYSSSGANYLSATSYKKYIFNYFESKLK